jgi:O-antigen ligase
VLVVAAAIGLLGMVYFAISNPEMLIVDDWGPFRILNSTNLQDANITTRFDHISLAIAEFMEKPLLGWGIAGYGGTEPYSSPVVFNWPHNITFEVLVELGIWGFILAGSAILLSYFDARKLYRRSRARHNDYIQQEALMIVIALTYTLINAHISGMLHINRTIWLAMGLIQAAIYEMPRVLPIENPTGNNPGSIVEAEEQLLPSN